MNIDGNKLNDWVEYKLLVLAELERLNDCIDKLQTHCNTTTTDLTNLNRDIKEAQKAISDANTRITQAHPETPEAKWKFYAALVTLVATALASIVSLVITLLSHG